MHTAAPVREAAGCAHITRSDVAAPTTRLWTHGIPLPFAPRCTVSNTANDRLFPPHPSPHRAYLPSARPLPLSLLGPQPGNGYVHGLLGPALSLLLEALVVLAEQLRLGLQGMMEQEGGRRGTGLHIGSAGVLMTSRRGVEME